jgi:hypothetical protein
MTLAGLKRSAWIFAAAGLAVSAALGIGHPDLFFQSYLFVFEYVGGVVLGTLGFSLLYLLVGGKWGRPLRRIYMAVLATVPWMSLLFIPVLLGIRQIYPWAQLGDNVQSLGAHKMWFFQIPFFVGRSIFYLVFFNALALWAYRMIRYELDHDGTPKLGSKRAGALGFLSFFVVMSLAAFDWTMSLQPHWYSSIYGALTLSGYGLSTLAFSIIVLNWLSQRYPDRFTIPVEACHDLGNLLLAAAMFWTYMSLSQYIIIWSGNLPEEISWYIARRDGGWRYLATLLYCGQFGYTFALLLDMGRKRVLQRLAKVAWWVMATRLLEAFWMVTPDYHPGKIVFHWMDLSLLLGISGVWMSFFLGRLKKEAAL